MSRWKYHLRMEDRRIPKNISTYNPKRRRNIGRPQLRWRDRHTLQEDGTNQTRPNPLLLLLLLLLQLLLLLTLSPSSLLRCYKLPRFCTLYLFLSLMLTW
jgi:hypothetical protein